ncbi:hypothetical protein NST04_23340 [Paenibacillus sp. FSL H7-0756]|uniref:hypothetical protein n=1 Tax=Paenibacillus sp. FSL H7-0756 TaxID=2954738 RepID=UPI0030F4BCCE
MIYSDPTGHRKTESYYEIEMLLNASMKGNSSYKNNLQKLYGNVYDDGGNTFKYLYGLLTQTSPYENSAGRASWAKGQLLNALETSQDSYDKKFGYVTAASDLIVGGGAVGFSKSSISLFRAVGPEEFYQIFKTGTFEIGGSGFEAKQFGYTLEETLAFANKFKDYAAIIEVKISKNALKKLGDFTSVDPFIFKSGTVTITLEKLGDFNKMIKEIIHAL